MILKNVFGFRVFWFFIGCVIGTVAMYASITVELMYRPKVAENEKEMQLIERARDSLFTSVGTDYGYWCFNVDTNQYWYDVYFHPLGVSYRVSLLWGLVVDEIEVMSKQIIRLPRPMPAPSPVPLGKNVK